MASERVERLAREKPEAFAAVAEKADGQLQTALKDILREQTGGRQRVAADD